MRFVLSIVGMVTLMALASSSLSFAAVTVTNQSQTQNVTEKIPLNVQTTVIDHDTPQASLDHDVVIELKKVSSMISENPSCILKSYYGEVSNLVTPFVGKAYKSTVTVIKTTHICQTANTTSRDETNGYAVTAKLEEADGTLLGQTVALYPDLASLSKMMGLVLYVPYESTKLLSLFVGATEAAPLQPATPSQAPAAPTTSSIAPTVSQLPALIMAPKMFPKLAQPLSAP